MKDLAKTEDELAQQSAVYSDEYPVIKNLKKKIAILKHAIAAAPQAAPAPAATDDSASSNVNLLVLRTTRGRSQSEL